MDYALIFQWSAILTGPFWLLVIFLPHWTWTRRLLASPLIVAPAAAAYAILIIPQLAGFSPLLLDASLENIAALLGSPAGATIGWIHFLAFDLFVGRWAYLDSREKGISAWLVSPVLFLILMAGPLGLLLYLGLHYWWKARRGSGQSAVPST